MKPRISRELKRYNYLFGETNAAYHQMYLKVGLSDSAAMILYTILEHGDSCLLKNICRSTGLSKQTINSALRKLEEEGIVYLEGMDGKKKRACLTEEGKRTAERTVVKLIEIENGILASWPREELEWYLELTERYLVALKGKVKDL